MDPRTMCRATVADQGPGEAVNDIEPMYCWYLQPGSRWDMRGLASLTFYDEWDCHGQ